MFQFKNGQFHHVAANSIFAVSDDAEFETDVEDSGFSRWERWERTGGHDLFFTERDKADSDQVEHLVIIRHELTPYPVIYCDSEDDFCALIEALSKSIDFYAHRAAQVEIDLARGKKPRKLKTDHFTEMDLFLARGGGPGWGRTDKRWLLWEE